MQLNFFSAVQGFHSNLQRKGIINADGYLNLTQSSFYIIIHLVSIHDDPPLENLLNSNENFENKIEFSVFSKKQKTFLLKTDFFLNSQNIYPNSYFSDICTNLGAILIFDSTYFAKIIPT